MNTFILIIIAIGMLAIPAACLFTFLTLLNKKWKHLLKYSLISLVLALICTTMGLISYSILGTDGIPWQASGRRKPARTFTRSSSTA